MQSSIFTTQPPQSALPSRPTSPGARSRAAGRASASAGATYPPSSHIPRATLSFVTWSIKSSIAESNRGAFLSLTRCDSLRTSCAITKSLAETVWSASTTTACLSAIASIAHRAHRVNHLRVKVRLEHQERIDPGNFRMVFPPPVRLELLKRHVNVSVVTSVLVIEGVHPMVKF